MGVAKSMGELGAAMTVYITGGIIVLLALVKSAAQKPRPRYRRLAHNHQHCNG